MSEKITTKKVVLVYMGRFESSKNTLLHGYKDEVSGEGCYFKTKLAPFSVGSRLECEASADGQTFKGPYKYAGAYQDKDQVQTWALTDRATYDQHTLDKGAKRPNTRGYDKAIASLRTYLEEVPRSKKRLALMRIMMDLGL